MQDQYSEHLLIFEAEDVNDKDWNEVIDCLKKHLPNFKTMYADGNYMNFRWGKEPKQKPIISQERAWEIINKMFNSLVDYSSTNEIIEELQDTYGLELTDEELNYILNK